MKVKLLAHTPEPDKIIAMAGKLCYSSSDLNSLYDNMTEEVCEKFIKKLIDLGHESPLEHVTFTFGLEGVSRNCTHQIVRHRIASYSQQSQRYVKLDEFEYVIPPSILANPHTKGVYLEAMSQAHETYLELTSELMYAKLLDCYPDVYKSICIMVSEDYNMAEVPGRDLALDYLHDTYKKIYSTLEKSAIEDARYVLPGASASKIIVTMNIRSLFNLFNKRCCTRAQWEIRQVANEMLRLCKEVSPLLFANAGAPCTHGECPEGSMSCKNTFRDTLLDEFGAYK